MKSFDIIIVGGSYAGLSAAMALGRSRRNVLIVDAGDPCNKTTPHSHNFLTQDGTPPKEIAEKGIDQVLKYPTVQIVSNTVSHIKTVKNSGFEVHFGADKIKCRRIILATGIKDILPAIPGFSDCWGKTIIHCPYCHGYEFSDQKTGILVEGEIALEMVKLINHWTHDLTLFTNGSRGLSKENREVILKKGVRIVDDPIQEVVHRKGILRELVFEGNQRESLEALYARVPFEQKSSLVKGLGCEVTETGHVKVDMFGKTTVEGIYAIGDCAHPMRSVATAVYTGNIAGAMLNKELIEEDF